MADKQFVGYCKLMKFSNGGEIVNVSFNKEDVEKIVQLSKENESGYVNLQLKTSKDGEKKYLEVNTWKPNGGGNGGGSQQSEPQYTENAQPPVDPNAGGDTDDGLPF